MLTFQSILRSCLTPRGCLLSQNPGSRFCGWWGYGPPRGPQPIFCCHSLGSQYQSLRQKAVGSRKALQQRHEVLKAESSGGGYQGHCLWLWGNGEGAQIQGLCSRWDSRVGGHAELTPKHPLGPPRPPDSDLPPSDASDLQGRQLLAGLDKVASDLDRQEKAITAILRPPLEQGRAVQDSAERAKDLKVPRAGGTGWPPGLAAGPAHSLMSMGALGAPWGPLATCNGKP